MTFERVKEPAGRDLLSWLIELATARLRSEVKRLKSERNRKVRIEEDIPETHARRGGLDPGR